MSGFDIEAERRHNGELRRTAEVQRELIGRLRAILRRLDGVDCAAPEGAQLGDAAAKASGLEGEQGWPGSAT